MTDTSYMQSVSIALGSYINAEATTYTFSITPTVPVVSTDIVLIYFPAEVTVPISLSSTSCSSGDTSIVTSVTCSFYQSTIT
jgi:hypothetical protein